MPEDKRLHNENLSTKAKAGKYLTFSLDNEEYGLEILKVREIIGLMEITRVPRSPHYIRGVINLRGKVIPVLDLRLKFDLEAAVDTDQTCIIVVEVQNQDMSLMAGIVVDSVSEVLDIKSGEIEDTPQLGNGVETEFILGMAKVKEEIKILLDIDSVLRTADISMLDESTEYAEDLELQSV